MDKLMDAGISTSDSVTLSSKLGAITLTEVTPEDFLTAISKRLVIVLITLHDSVTLSSKLGAITLTEVTPEDFFTLWEPRGTLTGYSDNRDMFLPGF